MSEDMTEVVKYIAQREEQLSKYSDKLRQSVQKIFDLFGDPTECQVCKWWDTYRSHFPYLKFAEHNYDEYGITEEQKNELLQSGKYFFAHEEGQKYNEQGQIRIWPNKDWHSFVPKIRLSLDVEAPTYMKDESKGTERKLASRKGKLVILEVILAFDDEITHDATDVSRKELKQIVKEKRISEFLEIYKQKLDQATQEYEDVSEIAEKMASVL